MRPWAGRVGLEQAWHPLHSPLPNPPFPYHLYSPGPWGLGLRQGPGPNPTEQSPIDGGHQGWVGGDRARHRVVGVAVGARIIPFQVRRAPGGRRWYPAPHSLGSAPALEHR